MKKKMIWIFGIALIIVIIAFITREIIEQQVRRITLEQVERITAEQAGTGNPTESSNVEQEEIDHIVEARTKHITSRILGGFDKVTNLHQVTWAGHLFEVGQRRTSQYNSSGIVEFTENGFTAGSNSMPRTKILDINMNQKIKVKVIAEMEGKLESSNTHCTTPYCMRSEIYRFTEFAIYFVDADETKYGIALLGTRDNISSGNTRDAFKFTEFTVENTGKEIIFTDSSGRTIVVDENSETEHKLSSLNKDEPWNLRINSHVNGNGYSKLKVKEIQVMT